MEGIQKKMLTNCDGCVHDWPSQRYHECRTESKALATYVMDNQDFNPAEFISLLAAEACKESVILEMPHQTLKRICLFHLDAMKEILEQY